MNAHTDAKHLAVCPACGSHDLLATMALGFVVNVCGGCHQSHLDEASLFSTRNERGGMFYPHTPKAQMYADCTPAEREEYEAIDAQIERDGNPDREHDSRGWE